MVTLLSKGFFEDDASWHNDQNFHVYEKAFVNSHPAPGSQLTWDTAAEWSEYEIGLEKARQLDIARQHLIEAVHEEASDVLGSSFEPPSSVTRSVDGKEGAADSEIML